MILNLQLFYTPPNSLNHLFLNNPRILSQKAIFLVEELVAIVKAFHNANNQTFKKYRFNKRYNKNTMKNELKLIYNCISSCKILRNFKEIKLIN